MSLTSETAFDISKAVSEVMRSRETLINILPNYLSTLPAKIYSPPELGNIITDFALAVNDPLQADAAAYLDHLVKKGALQIIHLAAPTVTIKRYLIGAPSVPEIALAIRKGAYLSHSSAAYIHGLIKQESSHFYVSTEGHPREKRETTMEQEAIDKAFSKRQRQSGTEIHWDRYRFLLLTGPYCQGRGIEEKGKIRLTGLERTLIDMTVRPQYGGGAAAVLQAFKNAKDQLNVPKLESLLDALNYQYPYYQAVGFYLSRAGYPAEDIKRFKKNIGRYQFYLDYAINDHLYDQKWQLFYPPALE